LSFAGTRILDSILGRGESAITVPALDGALRPNRKLDEAAERFAIEKPSGIVVAADGVYVSSENEILRLGSDGKLTPRHRAEAPISCLGPVADGIAAGLENGGVAIFGGRFDGIRVDPEGEARCPVAIDGAGDNLYVCNGSSLHPPSAWQRDLMERNASGSIWLLELDSKSRHRLASGLAFPGGIAATRETLVVSESWRHRLLRFDRSSGRMLDAPLDDFPGYPGPLSHDGEGGFLLSAFAPRSQLVEFVLLERKFRQRMMAEIEPRYWVAPTYRSGRSFYEPLQGGGVKHLGIMKPWAPTLSFGMVARLDENCLPFESLQSRADGITHGIVGAVAHDGFIYAASRGDNAVVKLALSEPGIRDRP
jgi:hypothetical protein